MKDVFERNKKLKKETLKGQIEAFIVGNMPLKTIVKTIRTYLKRGYIWEFDLKTILLVLLILCVLFYSFYYSIECTYFSILRQLCLP